ncbi:MAG: hypothetical protein ACI83O_000319 [Patescibacteria group bacterium]|jgi:hypothetical protein
MEENEYEKLMSGLQNPEVVKEATSGTVDVRDVYRRFKAFYFQVSHEDYYAAKKILDNNVELKKSLREEMRKLEFVRDKAVLSDDERAEVKRIESLMSEVAEVPETEKKISEKLTEIEQMVTDVRILLREMSSESE